MYDQEQANAADARTLTTILGWLEADGYEHVEEVESLRDAYRKVYGVGGDNCVMRGHEKLREIQDRRNERLGRNDLGVTASHGDFLVEPVWEVPSEPKGVAYLKEKLQR